MLSQRFFEVLRGFKKPFHQIAWQAGITPNQLYKITSGIDRPGKDDLRIIKLCNYLGLKVDDAFDGKHSNGDN